MSTLPDGPLTAATVTARPGPSDPGYAAAHAVFDRVLTHLRNTGWTQFRVDSLSHPDAPYSSQHPRAARTVRYHYTAGEWELHYEYDRNQHPNPGKTRRTARIVANRELPTVEQVIAELFGDTIFALLESDYR